MDYADFLEKFTGVRPLHGLTDSFALLRVDIHFLL